ncbi:MAG: thymidylate synthase [Candidatus Aenigmarchaeota archaeon]|nr:thymidylate synthase [Candidatus Aenigmarchaeota archaeon]
MFQSILKEKATSSNKLLLGEGEHVAIVTLWSKASEVAKQVRPSQYAVLGQLFSAERGLDLLVRNLLANSQITNIVVTGVDFSKSGIVLEDFFRNGFSEGVTNLTKKPVWRVESRFEGYIDRDIPREALDALRQSIVVTRATDLSAVNFFTLPKPAGSRQALIFPKKEEVVRASIGEHAGHVVRGKTIADAWVQALDVILRFGRESGTHYDEPQREILNLLSIIEEEDPARLHIPPYLPCDAQRVQEYIPRITRDLPGGTHQNAYTYGSRMRSWFGSDQVQRAVAKLAREPISRAVVVGLWDATKDLEIGGSPCLNHVWFRLDGDRLTMTCIFRSHDMFEGYPENAFGLRMLQEEVRAELSQRLRLPLRLGELMILSQSAHLYKDTWEWAEAVTKQQLPPLRRHLARLDPRGNFVISLDGEEIVLEHTGPGGEKIGEFRGRSGEELRDLLVRENVVSLIPHALDLGLELMKAELARTLGLAYAQDQPLPLGRERAPPLPAKVAEPPPLGREPAVQAAPPPAPALPADPRPAARPSIPANGRVIKEGLLHPDKDAYARILRVAKIDSFSLWS